MKYEEYNMSDEKFLTGIQQALQTEENLSLSTVLEDLEEWDSLGMMTTAVFLEKEYGFKTTVNELVAYQTIEELYKEVKK